jgi:hypothetical protein
MTQVQFTTSPATAALQLPQSAAKTTLSNAQRAESAVTHLLHFEPLTYQGAGLDIPCDPQGRVGLDALGDKLRNDYFFARALIGRLFDKPTVKQALPLMHA